MNFAEVAEVGNACHCKASRHAVEAAGKAYIKGLTVSCLRADCIIPLKLRSSRSPLLSRLEVELNDQLALLIQTLQVG